MTDIVVKRNEEVTVVFDLPDQPKLYVRFGAYHLALFMNATDDARRSGPIFSRYTLNDQNSAVGDPRAIVQRIQQLDENLKAWVSARHDGDALENLLIEARKDEDQERRERVVAYLEQFRPR